MRLDPVLNARTPRDPAPLSARACAARWRASGSFRSRRSPRPRRRAADTTTGGRSRCARGRVAGECDTLGRPVRARRLHVVDSSCFPVGSRGNVTFPAMANAYRIATAADRAEDAWRDRGDGRQRLRRRADHRPTCAPSGIETVALVAPAGAATTSRARSYALGSRSITRCWTASSGRPRRLRPLCRGRAAVRTVNLQGSLPLLERPGRARRAHAADLLAVGLRRGPLACTGARSSSSSGRCSSEAESRCARASSSAPAPGTAAVRGRWSATLSRRALAPLIGGGAQRLFVTHDQRLCELVSALIAALAGAERAAFRRP